MICGVFENSDRRDRGSKSTAYLVHIRPRNPELDPWFVSSCLFLGEGPSLM